MDTHEDEYATFVRARSHALLRSAYLLAGDQQLAEDLVQEALARTHRAWLRLRDTGNAEAYARRIMYHRQVSVWRRRKVTEVLTGDLSEPIDRSSHDDAESITRRVTVERALRMLSPRQRAVVVLRYFEDRTEAEAAQILDVSVGTIKAQTKRALEHLRKLVPELREFRTAEGTGR